MKNIKEQYKEFREAKQKLEQVASEPAQRMLNFLRKWHPHGYVDFSLFGGRNRKDSINRFVLKTDSKDVILYEGEHDDRAGDNEYFFLPFEYIEDPDSWEKDIKAKVKADRKLVRRNVEAVFSDSPAKKSEYYLYAYPHEKNPTRFLRVVVTEGDKPTNNPQLIALTTGYHSGFVYDRNTYSLWLDGPVGYGELPIFDWTDYRV